MSDLRYSVFGFIDSSGAVIERAKYDGYGKRTLMDPSYSAITTPVVDQSYGYTGIRHDSETSLQYYRARYFDNNLGRFINRDPKGFKDGLSLYRAYFVIGGNDPSGLTFTEIEFTVTLALLQEANNSTSWGLTPGAPNVKPTYRGHDKIKPEVLNPTTNCWMAEVDSALSIDLTALSFVPNDNIPLSGPPEFAISYIPEIILHEAKRRSVMRLGYEAYFKESQESEKNVMRCGKVCKREKGYATQLLKGYLGALRTQANYQFHQYNYSWQYCIDNENFWMISENGIVVHKNPDQSVDVQDPSPLLLPDCPK